MLFTIILYVLAVVLLLWSFLKDRQKTKAALKKAWKAFENILPQFLAILLIIGMTLAFVSPEVISTLLGRGSGWRGILTAGAIGSVTLIPGFVAFPQIAAFISTLMMVGVVTLPAEFKVLGRKAALLRNGLALVFSFVVAAVMGVVL